MGIFITLIIGFLGGVGTYYLKLKTTFKTNTLERKIKVYSSIISQWVLIRSSVVNGYELYPDPNITDPDDYNNFHQEIDRIYNQSLIYMGEIILVCSNQNLIDDIDRFNEKIYRSKWFDLSLNDANKLLEDLKSDAKDLITRMRKDVESSSYLSCSDFNPKNFFK